MPFATAPAILATAAAKPSEAEVDGFNAPIAKPDDSVDMQLADTSVFGSDTIVRGDGITALALMSGLFSGTYQRLRAGLSARRKKLPLNEKNRASQKDTRLDVWPDFSCLIDLILVF